MKRSLIEEGEGFGAPPVNDRLDAATEALLSSGVWLEPDAALPLCFAEAERVMGESYTEALEAWLGEINAEAGDLASAFSPAARRFFHAAARVGEARLLMKLAERAFERSCGHAEMADGER